MPVRMLLSLLTVLVSASAAAEPADKDDFIFLDNGRLKLGVEKSSGAGIAWLSASGSERNLINHFDRGRLVQQSYYGKEDGSLWNKQPWRYNPVQGGDWRGKGAIASATLGQLLKKHPAAPATA